MLNIQTGMTSGQSAVTIEFDDDTSITLAFYKHDLEWVQELLLTFHKMTKEQVKEAFTAMNNA